jgi:hypothetical protein
MPAIIHESPDMIARGLVLQNVSAQEQITGLLDVQMDFVACASSVDQIRSKFYVDAPPPLMPPFLRPGDLLTNRLYLKDHSIQIANGLAQIRAAYVGGVLKSRWKGYAYTEAREYFTLINTYRMERKKIHYTFVQINGSAAPLNIQTPTRKDLLRVIGFARQRAAAASTPTQLQGAALESRLSQYISGTVAITFDPSHITPSVALVKQSFFLD